MEHSTNPPRRSAALVARVSTDAQNTVRQVEAVREAAARFAPDLPTIEVFESGSAYKTSIFDRQPDLIAAIERGEVEIVFADAQDRLGRHGEEEWIAFRALCEANGTRLFIDGNDDVTGERFVARLGAAWQVAPLPERHRLIAEHVLAIECSDEAVGFSFATALPVDTIYLPATDVCARNLTNASTNTEALLVALIALDGAFQTTKGDRSWQSQ